jgi:uncharacterized protein
VTPGLTHVQVDERRRVSVVASGPADATWTFIYAPGASARIEDPFGLHLSQALPEAGMRLVRFQFPYMEAGRSGPDPNPVLEATWRAVIDAFRADSPRLAVGGRSMGGRIASQVVAEGEPVEALCCFAYPLHPPGRPDRRRDAHLAKIGVPALFCWGTRDDFASAEELTEAASRIPLASLHLLDGADHGFNVRKSSGRTREDVWREATDALIAFLTGAAPSS